VGQEPREPVYARVALKPRPGAAQRPTVDLCFVLDASASMHRFVLNPVERSYWQQRAEQRGEVTRQQADGRTGMVWTGQTLRELQQIVSTPMLSSLRGVWRTLESLQSADRPSVLGFADEAGVVYEDAGAETATRLAAAKTALAKLGSGVDESGLGRGTRLAGALRHAVERFSVRGGEAALRRIVLVSDGIIEDADQCQPLLDRAVDLGCVISVIGVADDFDEEYLMRVADLTRGSYVYAATAVEVERALGAELEAISQVVGREAVLSIRPENGTMIQDVYPLAPDLSEFHTMWHQNGTWRFRIGDVSAAQPSEFLVALAPGRFASGTVAIASVGVEALGAATGERYTSEASIGLFYADEPVLLQAQDDSVLDAVRRLEIYREERRAAGAAARGDQEGATRHLRAATRMLRSRGDDQLADEMDAAASEAEAGTRNLSRTKRVKAGTRRLGRRPEPA